MSYYRFLRRLHGANRRRERRLQHLKEDAIPASNVQQAPNQRLKILLSVYSCGPDRGSEPGVGWNWALALARRGHEVCAITRSLNRSAIEAALANRQEAANLRFIYHDLKWPRKHAASGPVANLVYAAWQRTLLGTAYAEHLRVRFDVAHHLTFGSWRQPSRLWQLGIPFVFGPVGGGEEAPPKLIAAMPPRAKISELARNSWNKIAVNNPAVRRTLRAASVVPVKTRETGAWVGRAGGSPNVSLEIGIEPAQDIACLGRAPGEPLRCLFVGRLIEWKGVRMAIDAIAQARLAGADARLTIVGAGPMEDDLRAMVAARALDDAVTFAGAVSQTQVFNYYRNHHVKLFPSMHDSSGNVVLEALAFGLPVVCLALGGPREMVDLGCGIPVRCDNINWNETAAALGAQIVELDRDEERRQMLSAGAIKRAGEMTWNAAVARVYGPIEARCRNGPASQE